MKIEENKYVFEDSVDLVAILKTLFKSRLLIIKISVLFVSFGLVIALGTPNTYTAGSTFIAQSNNSGLSSGGGLTGLASLAGISLSNLNSDSGIPPNLYPEILNSVPFKRSLLDQDILFQEKSLTLRDYLLREKGFSLKAFLSKYVLGLPGLLFSIFKEKEINTTEPVNFDSIDIISLEDSVLFAHLDNKLKLVHNKEEGFITLEFSDIERDIAAQVATLAKSLLQQRIINFKIQASKELLDYSLGQYEEKRKIYEKLQDSLALVKDQNLFISSTLFQNKVDRLQQEVDIASSIALQLATQVEQSKLQVSKDTPVFTVIDPVTIPYQRAAPKRNMIVMIWFVLGFLFGSVYVLSKSTLRHLALQIRDK